MMAQSLRRRLAIAFAALTLCVGIVGAGLAFLLIYSVEDEMFNRLVDDEVTRINATIAGGGSAQPLLPFVELLERDDLPPPVFDALADNERRREASGANGQHYHFRPVTNSDNAAPPMYVVAQVSDYLVVRPMRLDVINFLAALSLAFTLLAAVFGVWLAYRYTRPLNRLTNLIGAADPTGLPQGFADQFDDLESRRLATELERNYRRIAELVERERRFTQDASHELRTPLAVSQNALELLRAQPMSEQQTMWLGRIGLAVGVMQQSVEALLMLAREDFAESAKQPVRLLPLVERAIVNHAAQLDEQTVSVNVDVPADWSIATHEGALQIIVSNLVGNAFQHCQEGEVVIRLENDTLTVGNPAASLPADIAVRATQPQVKGADSTGMGLGLSICDRLCGRLGWDFSFRRLGDSAAEAVLDFATPR